MRLRTSVLAKVIVWFLIAVSGIGLVGSAVLAVGMEEEGIYEQTYDELRTDYFSRFNDRYSARVLDYLSATEETNQEYFADRNFKYGVIEADFLSDLDALDLNDKSNYVDTNFDFTETYTLKDMHTFWCTINENTYFQDHKPDSIFGYYWIYMTRDNWNWYDIDNFVCDTETGIILAQAGGIYYPVPRVDLKILDDLGSSIVQSFEFDKEKYAYTMPADDIEAGTSENMVLEITVVSEAENEEIYNLLDGLRTKATEQGVNFTQVEGTALSWDNWVSTAFKGNKEAARTATEEIVISDVESTAAIVFEQYFVDIELSFEALDYRNVPAEFQKEIRISDDYNAVHLGVKSNETNSKSYVVLSYQEEDFVYDRESLLNGDTDVFGQFDFWFQILYNARYDVIGIFFGCLVVFLCAFIFLCCAAGYKKGQTELTESWVNRIPLELYAGAAGLAETFGMMVLFLAVEEIDSIKNAFFISISISAGLFSGLLFVAIVLEVVTRIKLKTLWTRTIVCWFINKFFGGISRIRDFMAENISLTWKIIAVAGINAFADFIIFIMMIKESGFGVFLFLVKNMVLLLFALNIAAQLKKLKEAGEHIAKGDMTYRVDTEKMYWDFRKHGENLNSVGEGLVVAVEERMKSERFKTELITNVSHDIKTPLTSIINYVDLMQKEETANAKITEYLEVLERQSKRLKKLLEDLLEASKASAGTLAVSFERLEAGVFMVQTVGEFEEKTSAQSLELLIKKPEEPVYISADGRHLWRIIDNLMNNICKYAQPGTRVYINLEATAEEVQMTFRNTSRYPLNITSEELMERFVRGDASRHTEGSGLGLSIAQSLTELIHGKFELVVDGDLFKVILTFERV